MRMRLACHALPRSICVLPALGDSAEMRVLGLLDSLGLRVASAMDMSLWIDTALTLEEKQGSAACGVNHSPHYTQKK